MIHQFCRICHGRSLTRYLDLGFTPLADSFLRAQSLQHPETYYPLEVFLCQECGLSQLGFVVSPETLYQHDYPYESSTTAAGRAHFFGLAESVVERFALDKTNLCVDIGSNVGVLLDGFKAKGCQVLGVEPSAHIAALAVGREIPTRNEFFTPQLASEIASAHAKASVITATNVFAHVDDLDRFMEAVTLLLTDDGVFIIEAPHFLKLIEDLEYDTIYHEHLSYLAIRPLEKLFQRFGFEIFDVELVGIHGGSIRIFVGKAGSHEVTSVPGDMTAEEERANIFEIERLMQFGRDVAQHRIKLMDLLRSLKADDRTVAGVSAPAKGMTLLNYCRIGPDILDFVTEKSRLKIGRYTPGMHLPVLPDSALMSHRPNYALLLAWNFADEIINNLSDYQESGGKFIIPIPEPHIV